MKVQVQETSRLKMLSGHFRKALNVNMRNLDEEESTSWVTQFRESTVAMPQKLSTTDWRAQRPLQTQFRKIWNREVNTNRKGGEEFVLLEKAQLRISQNLWY